ncbi:hypothetical protein ACENGC_000504 [Escherichia coli]
MSGFEVYNNDGKILIDSQNRATMFNDLRTIGAVTDLGAFAVASPFGDGHTLGYPGVSFWSYYNGGQLRWAQLAAGRYAFPGADLYEANAGRMIRTSRAIGIQSGYLDVFDASGSLVWSAAAAASMPRVVGFLDIPAGYDLQSNVFSVSLNFNPWILLNNCPGNAGGDGTASGYSGLLLRWTGAQLQACYVSRNQRSWAQTFQSDGLRVPLVQFVGI